MGFAQLALVVAIAWASWNITRSLPYWPVNPRLLAGLIAGVVAWRTQNIFYTIGAGMLALWGLQGLQWLL